MVKVQITVNCLLRTFYLIDLVLLYFQAKMDELEEHKIETWRGERFFQIVKKLLMSRSNMRTHLSHNFSTRHFIYLQKDWCMLHQDVQRYQRAQ